VNQQAQTQVNIAPTPKLSFITAKGMSLQRKCACGGSAGMSGECEACQEKHLTVNRYAADRRSPFRLLPSPDEPARSQTPLSDSGGAQFGAGYYFGRVRVGAAAPSGTSRERAISEPGDRSEEEADRVAAAVMRALSSPVFEEKLEAPTLSQTSPQIQRAVADESASEMKAAPETATVPETAAPEAAPAAGLIVEDDAQKVEPGQMRKSEFLEQLRATVCATADAALAEVGQSAKGCPYIERWIENFRTRSSQYLERAIRKYAPESAGVTAARDYIPFVAERARRGIARWATTGEITEVPEELANQIPGAGIASILGSMASAIGSAISGAVSGLARGVGRLVSGIGSLFTKAREGAARPADNPLAIQSQLRSGAPLDGGVRTRMERAFGHDFSAVRVHNDGAAARLSADLNARAFTVGKDIAFGASEYRPGTLVGDALIAHELAHVVQQRGSTAAMAPMSNHGSERSALEEDADESAAEAVVAGLSGTKRGLSMISRTALPRLKSNLRLQRCSGRERKLNIKEMGEKWRKQFLKENFSNKERSEASKIMEDMLESNEITFWDEKALKDEIFKRMKTSQLMHEADRLYGVAFEYPNHPASKKCLPNNEKGDRINPRVNKAAEKYWGPVQDPQGDYHWDLSDEGKKNAYEALRTLFTPQKSICDMTLIHCDYLASVVHFRAFAESLGVEEFNQRVRNGDIEVRLRWNGFQELEDIGWFHSEKSVSLRNVRPANEKELVIGDHVIFWNHRAYDLINRNIGNAWRLENAILVRKKGKEDIFLGHGSGRNTDTMMRAKLTKEYNEVVAMAEKIIARTKSKDPKVASAAEAEMSQKFPHVKNEAGEWKITGRAHGKSFDEKLERIKSTDPDMTGLREPQDPSKMGCVKRPMEAPGESC
jgi:hypothetical protein